MPRLTNSDYLLYRAELAALFEEQVPVQVFLSYRDQLVLHDYFAPTQELTDAEAIAHRLAITQANPSLPNRAGKILRQIEALRSIDWTRAPRRW